MATSGTYAQTTEHIDLVDEAFERCGILPGSLSAGHLSAAARSLHYAQSHWETTGLGNVYRTQAYVLPLVLNQAEQVVPPEVLFVSEMVYVQGTTETPVTQITAGEYLLTVNKTTPGVVSQVWHDRGRTPKLVCWMVPDVASSLRYLGVTMHQDILLGSSPDTKRALDDAFASELAARLAVKFRTDRVAMLRTEADRAHVLARQFTRDRTDVRFYTGRVWGS